MPDVTIRAEEFIRYLEWRIAKEILPPLVPYPEAIMRFGSEPVVVTVDDTGEATLSSLTGRGGPDSAETSPGRTDPGKAGA